MNKLLALLSALSLADQRPCEHSDTLARLRKLMENRGYDGYIVPSEDHHLNEYVAPEYRRRGYMTGLSGSAGTAVITATSAAVITDSRYCIAAEKEVYCGWEIICPGSSANARYWLSENLKKNDIVGADPFLFTESSWKSYENHLRSFDITVVEDADNIVDQIWTDQPSGSEEPLTIQSDAISGASVNQKISMITAQLDSASLENLFVTRLDSIAWLLNLRGDDVPYSPVFFSYFLLEKKRGTWTRRLFVRTIQKFDAPVMNHLNAANVAVEEYNHANAAIKTLQGRALFPGTGTTWGMLSIAKTVPELILYSTTNDRCPIEYAKSIKNPTEIEYFRKYLKIDSIALAIVLAEVEKIMSDPAADLTEYEVAEMLMEKRANLSSDYRGEAFGAISAIGENAANPHYDPPVVNSAYLRRDTTFLLDQGGQYIGATCDVTRTVYFGEPPQEVKDSYTRVLQGNLAMSRGIYPAGTPGYKMEPFARQFLYRDHKDYGHGTGHGLGYYLLVHEGPNGIGGSPSTYNYAGFVPGMLTSNEPGYYKAGDFGIRIEDDELVIDDGDNFIAFEKLNLVPYERSLINEELLTDEDREQLDTYHAKCAELAHEYEVEHPEAAAWILARTEPFVDHASAVQAFFSTSLIFLCYFL